MTEFSQYDKQKVALNCPLVYFIHNDMCYAFQVAICFQSTEQNSLSNELSLSPILKQLLGLTVVQNFRTFSSDTLLSRRIW